MNGPSGKEKVAAAIRKLEAEAKSLSAQEYIAKAREALAAGKDQPRG